MKSILTLGILLISNTALAGDLYSIQELWSGNSPSYKVGDVLYCSGLDSGHNIALGCISLTALNKYEIYENRMKEIKLRNKSTNEVLVIGNILPNSERVILDEMTSGLLYKINDSQIKNKLEATLLVKKTFSPNYEIGCSGAFDCDWRLVYPKNKVYLNLNLNNVTLERVRIN